MNHIGCTYKPASRAIVGAFACFLFMGIGHSVAIAQIATFSKPPVGRIPTLLPTTLESFGANFAPEHILFSGIWRTDGGFEPTIRIKNVLAVASLQVTPTLYMADGTKYTLPALVVPVSGVVTVDINEALRNVPQSLVQHVSTYGSAALQYRDPSSGHVTASLAVIDPVRSLSFNFPFVEQGSMQTTMGENSLQRDVLEQDHDMEEQVMEGLWWKHDEGVGGFVGLTNTTGREQKVILESDGRQGNSPVPQSVTLEPHATKILDLDALAPHDRFSAKKVAGGIRVRSEIGAVIAIGGLVNESEGYSANIPFLFHETSSSTTPKTLTYASAGIMVGKPDPMMMPGFPKETTFNPYLVLRNTTEKPLAVSLQLNYMMGMAGGDPVTRDFPLQLLRPFEARLVQLEAALDAAGLKNFDGSINLSTSITGNAGDLVLATGSVDETGTYVFEVEPQGVGTSRSKIAGYWGVSNGNDTMFTLWNPTAAAQDILVTFYYADGSGQYKLLVHLGPQASTMIDMAMLIAENKPDPEGHLIPPNIQEGSAQFASANGRNEMINVAIAGGIYNVSTATCIGDCIWCCGVSNFGISPGSLSCGVGGTATATTSAMDCNGFEVYPVWSSSNTTVATVDSNGNVSCASAGQATITAYWGNEVTTSNGGLQQFCGISSCPTTNQQSSVTATVCSFTITPASATANDCTTATQNTITFVATPFPNSSSCFLNQSQSTCAKPTSTGTIDLVLPDSCTGPTGAQTMQDSMGYFAGPPGPGNSAGTITVGFTLILARQPVTKSVTAPIACP